MKAQHWAYETTSPSAGAYQPVINPGQKETTTTRQSILVKPDAYKHNAEKVKNSKNFSDQGSLDSKGKCTVL